MNLRKRAGYKFIKMNVWSTLEDCRRDILAIGKPTIATVGNFDGVHRGHQAILRRMMALKQARNLPAIMLTFENHTESLLGKQPGLLNTPEFRRELLARQGVDGVLEVEFNRELASLGPEGFFSTWLMDGMRVGGLVVGYDFKFGAGARGDYQMLEKLGAAEGIRVERVSPVQEGEIVISSSKIRELISQGAIEIANQLLGYSFLVTGEVVKGEQRGRGLGFPTANLSLKPGYIQPKFGVYLVKFRTGEDSYFGVASIGVKPTFGQYAPLLEVHLFDVQLDLYGQLAQVEFLKFIRPEQKFANAEALVAQMKKDLQMAKDLAQEY
ncbi:MAG TPA: bifunctional riboflavin kinase/FAD synthetase [Bacillota bacterium]|nr:bifunctional riboflavin kinase/FAD synthetase [Bacillota bacterium]